MLENMPRAAQLTEMAMSFKLSIDTEADAFSIKVDNVVAEDRDLVATRLTEVADLFRAIIASDEAAKNLTDDELTRLQPGLAALELKYKLLIYQATQQAMAAKAIAEGRETIAEHGFLELDDV